jgi:hypothetical protein
MLLLEPLLEEYKQVKSELSNRALMLHWLILLAIITGVVFIISTFIFIQLGLPIDLILTFLFLIPIIFAGLTFNYQANQMTLEALAGYINEELKLEIRAKAGDKTIRWDEYYGRYKKDYRMTSFLKVTPFLLPFFVPTLALFAVGSMPANIWLQILYWFDWYLFALVIFNFRYKIR